ncbi:MAG: hypothetical protein ABW321_24585, partial [Polyangiales bacterium]
VLFVIDNSGSMAGEQAQLRAQIPRLAQTLTTGLRYPDDPYPFTPIRDLHIGVVTTDMGIPGVAYPPCSPDGGDDGALVRASRSADPSCNRPLPPFQSFESAGGDAEQLAKDAACMASVGNVGCGFEQQLEAPLKALWPREYIDADGELISPNPLSFLATTQGGTFGKADLPLDQNGNAGFLRNDPEDPSLLLIVLLTDEEDCSVTQTEHIRPTNQLPEDSPYRDQDINLRCYYSPQHLYDVQQRYYYGLRAAKPGQEDLVVFTAIAGVPPELVSSEVLDATDFSDAAARDQFYANILDNPAMAYTPDAQTGTGQGNLLPSCSRIVPGEEVPSTAYPPRRIVELAHLFGENGLVQSICQDDFTPALNRIVNVMAKPLSEMCMDESLERDAAGKVDCQLVWQLPAASAALPAGTPTDCSALGDLLEPGVAPESLPNGTQRCVIRQLGVGDDYTLGEGRGWYYDDFSDDLARMCSAGRTKRVALAEGVRAPQGVSVDLECFADATE